MAVAHVHRKRISGLSLLLGAALVAGVGLVAEQGGTGASTGSESIRLEAYKNHPTPGSFTGYAFDQCDTPSQRSMDRWLTDSPYFGIGIYISGNARACRTQANLTATWVHHQLANGWKLLPLTVGPQASCNPHFSGSLRINANPEGTYGRARKQGRAEAASAIAAARRLGIPAGSTLFYDLEGFDINNARCRASAMWFLNGWTTILHDHHYLSGVYSSAGSGIKALDQMRTSGPKVYKKPDELWIADWDGKANTQSSYLSDNAWLNKRVKQYAGGHNATYGTVTINVDSDFVNVRHGSYAPLPYHHCGNVNVTFDHYYPVKPPTRKAKPNPKVVKALKCLLKERGPYTGKINGTYDKSLHAAINAWQRSHHMPVNPIFGRRNWMALLAKNSHPTLKYGGAGERVRDLQRTLDAVDVRLHLPVTGIYDARTKAAVAKYQATLGWKQTGIAQPWTWRALANGHYVKPLT